MNISKSSGKLTRVASGSLGSPRLSADGSTVVYTRWNGANWDVERHREGEVTVIADTPRQDTDPKVSANGDTVVWSTLKPEEPNPSWNVYRWKDGEQTELAASPANEDSAEISSDGEVVVYTYDDTSSRIGFDIHRCEGDQCEAITTGWKVDTDPFLSGDGETTFFRRKVRFDGGDLWMRDSAGELTQITKDPHPEIRPTASSDGSTLAWAQNTHRDEDTDLFVLDLESGVKERIGVPGVDEGNPGLSADGSVLVYDSSSSGKSDIMLREDGETVNLTNGGINRWPSISADGKTVAWANLDPDSGETTLYKLELSE